jgi:hypothetical protein
MSDYADHLFSYVPTDRLETFSFGHVIPPENLTALTLAEGVLGSEFNFTYDHRRSEKMVSLPFLYVFCIYGLEEFDILDSYYASIDNRFRTNNRQTL